MRKATHILFATALVALLGFWNTKAPLLYTVLAALSSLVPDIDLKYMHRKLLHNVFVPLLIAVVIYYPLSLLGVNAHYLTMSILIGWLSHVLLDAVTIRGVYLFYPLFNVKITLKICKSDSLLWNILLSLISLTIIIYSIKVLALS